MYNIVITEDNSEEFYNILYNNFNDEVVWVGGECVGKVSVRKSEPDTFHKTVASIYSVYEYVLGFSIGDKVEVSDDYIILNKDNELSRILDNIAGSESKPVIIEKLPINTASYEKYMARSLCDSIQYGFSTQVSFGKGMICTGEYADSIEESVNRDEDDCLEVINSMRNELESVDKHPDVIKMSFMLRNNPIEISIDWKNFVTTGCPNLVYTYMDNKYEDLIEVFFELR